MPVNGEPESELEKLFQSAEKDPPPEEPKISTFYECSKCGVRCAHQCPKCLGPFCETHASPIDPIYCNLCLPGWEVKELPLTDADGKVVNGRRLEVDRPHFMTTSKWISEQTDDELRKEIERFKVDIHLSETNLLNKKITKLTMERELSERDHAAKLALRAFKQASPARLNIPKKPGAPSKPAKAPASNAMAAAMMTAMEFLMKQSKQRAENKKKSEQSEQ
jgi:hypothetical protein